MHAPEQNKCIFFSSWQLSLDFVHRARIHAIPQAKRSDYIDNPIVIPSDISTIIQSFRVHRYA